MAEEQNGDRAGSLKVADRPNILLITADDMDGFTPGAFGGPADVSPGLDRLAREGMTFHRAHVTTAVCQPSRSALMTGRWPHRNGAEGFEPVRDTIPLLTELLNRRGYRCGILGKVQHLQPVERFGWTFRRGMGDLGMGRDPSKYQQAAKTFFAAAKAAGEPWFLMANAHDPHRPFHGSEQEEADFSSTTRAQLPAPSRVFEPEDELSPPGFLPNLPEVRREYAEYLSSARRCDDVVSGVLAALEDAGAADDTLVVFLSDNGMAFPFAKSNCYLRSTLTPLIVRWPGVVPSGAVQAETFVSTLDLFPTFCAAAGIEYDDDIDGRSLMPLLCGQNAAHRTEIMTVFHETSTKRRYEMRCVQDANFGYIWNAWADGSALYQAENMNGRTWQAMLDAAPLHASTARRAKFYLHREPEELYDLRVDPDGLHNLVQDAAYGAVLAGYRSRLRRWMERTEDPLVAHFTADSCQSG